MKKLIVIALSAISLACAGQDKFAKSGENVYKLNIPSYIIGSVALPVVADGYWGTADVEASDGSNAKVTAKSETRTIVLGKPMPDHNKSQLVIVKKINETLYVYPMEPATQEEADAAKAKGRLYTYSSQGEKIKTGKYIQCPRCKGAKNPKCPVCNGTGRIPEEIAAPKIVPIR